MSRGRGKRTERLVEAAAIILDEIHPASVRAVCYQLLMQSLIPDMSKNTTNSISQVLKRAREAGKFLGSGSSTKRASRSA